MRAERDAWTIWHDRDQDQAEWIRRVAGLPVSQTRLAELARPQAAGAFARLPATLQQLLYLDKHDIILTLNRSGAERPVVALELMTHTPQSQHTKQRFCRIVAAAEQRVPCAFVFPERKRSGNQMYTCTLDIFYALQRLTDIHHIPSFGYFWPDTDGELRFHRQHPSAPAEAGEIRELIPFLRLCTHYARQERPFTLLLSDPQLRPHLDRNRRHAYAEPITVDRYHRLRVVATQALVSELARSHAIPSGDLPDYFLSRSQSLVQEPRFEARLSRQSFRTDPYAGMQAFFDYCFCRIGPSTSERQQNLVLRARGVPYRTYASKYALYWERRCPFRAGYEPQDIPLLNLHVKSGCRYTKSKALRTYGYISDMLIFDDFVIYG
ncbi:MAG: hypothetical protein ACE5R4_08845 [Armatimonadota bacterium]